MLTLSSIALTHNKKLDKYNEMARSKIYRWNADSSKKGDLFGFYFYGKFIRIHEILESKEVLILTQELIEISWEEWVYLNGPNVTRTKQYNLINYPLLESRLFKIKNPTLTEVKESRVQFKEPMIEIPTSKIIKRLIQNLNKEVDYDGTLWNTIYCLINFDNVYYIWKRRDKLLLNYGFYQNNCHLYPKEVLRDYKIIAQQYNKWNEYIKEKFENNNGKIVKYNGIKKQYFFMDSKDIKWDYYEKSNLKLNLL
jgi:hypothetical protein